MAAGDVEVTNTPIQALKCWGYKGINGRVYLPIDSTLFFTNKDFTISARIKYNELGTSKGFMSRYITIDGERDFVFEINTSGKPYFGLYEVGGLSTGIKICNAADVVVADGKWHCVIARYNSTTRELICYADGTASAPYTMVNAANNGNVQNPNSFQLGYDQRISAAMYFNNNIADVQFFQTLLTSDEITKVSEGVEVLRGLKYRWNFKNNSYVGDIGNVTATNVNGDLSINDGNLSPAIKSQRVASTDKWLLTSGEKSDILVANIE